MHSLRFRQIHLDFHTSEAIAEIGRDFDKKHWQETLKGAHVDSITCFAVCHHGWSYYDTRVGCRHPHLDFDLTRAMYDACREINVNVPLYVTAGFNNYIARIHPQWRCINHEGHYIGSSQKPIDPGYYLLCFNTPYLDYLCQQIREVATLFPQASGIFLDIIHKSQCCCPWCLESMEQRGLKAEDPVDRAKNAEIVLDNYYRRTLEALRSVSPAMPLFQNSGHVQRGERRFLDYVTHLELESLPTGGWGYDHFAMAAKYAKLTGLDFLGMTGKFHTTWGEFGGFKHPNALRYECAAMLAYGAKCSVGDQLDPRGRLDESTYGIIAGAYAEVEAKEPWCRDATNVADVALLSSVAVHPDHPRQDDADTGASRLLLEGHVLFDILDGQMDFSPYKALVLPDDLVVSESLKAKLDAYLSAGGKLLMTGNSALAADGKTPLFDIGAEIAGPGEFKLNFILPIPVAALLLAPARPGPADTLPVSLRRAQGQHHVPAHADFHALSSHGNCCLQAIRPLVHPPLAGRRPDVPGQPAIDRPRIADGAEGPSQIHPAPAARRPGQPRRQAGQDQRKHRHLRHGDRGYRGPAAPA